MRTNQRCVHGLFRNFGSTRRRVYSTYWRQVLKYELQETRKSQESFRDLYVRQRRENEDLKVLMKMHKQESLNCSNANRPTAAQTSLSNREKDHFELINYLRQENERKDKGAMQRQSELAVLVNATLAESRCWQ